MGRREKEAREGGRAASEPERDDDEKSWGREGELRGTRTAARLKASKTGLTVHKKVTPARKLAHVEL